MVLPRLESVASWPLGHVSLLSETRGPCTLEGGYKVQVGAPSRAEVSRMVPFRTFRFHCRPVDSFIVVEEDTPFLPYAGICHFYG